MGVGVARQHLVADEVLDEGQRPPARGVVGVGDAARPVRAVHDLVVADHRLADAPQQRGLGCVGADGWPRTASLRAGEASRP